MNLESIVCFASSSMTVSGLCCAIFFGFAYVGDRQSASGSEPDKAGKVREIAFESLRVSDLEKSIKYYQAIGFSLRGEANPTWIKDPAANRLYKTPDAMSRTATLTIARTSSGQPFILYLRQYKNAGRGGRVDFPARDPSSAHFGLMVPEAEALWERLQSAGMLRPLSWEGKLIRMHGQTTGGLAYVRDPDGFNIEIIGVRSDPSGKSDRQVTQKRGPTIHHLGLVVLSSDKSRAFYGDLLGAKFPETLPDWVSGDNYDAVVGGHGYVIRLINGAFPDATSPQATMPFELVEYRNPTRTKVDDYGYADVAVNCVGFQVEGLDALYGRLKAAGVKSWSDGGIVQKGDGTRAVVVRDPDVGSFVELFEKP